MTVLQKVPLVDLGAQQAEVNDEVTAGLRDVFENTSFIGGPQVGEFEQAYARLVGARHCVGVANGTDALELALRASGVTPGGEVILPANTFIATAEAVSRIGARPVLVDVDPTHLLIDPRHVAEAVTDQTQAIVPVHLFGQVAPVELLEPIARASGAVIVEDAAQSQGATRHGHAAGSLGIAAGTSFYPGKNLGAAGDAGAVTTSSDEVAAHVRLLGAHGSSVKYQHDVIGMNSRLDTVQAVVLNAKLRRLAGWNERRRTAAAYYSELLADVSDVLLPVTADGNVDVWHLYVIRLPDRDRDRDRIMQALTDVGIGVGVHYPVPVHRTRAFAHLGYAAGDFAVAEAAAATMLSLPLYPHITPEQQRHVVHSLGSALSS